MRARAQFIIKSFVIKSFINNVKVRVVSGALYYILVPQERGYVYLAKHTQ